MDQQKTRCQKKIQILFRNKLCSVTVAGNRSYLRLPLPRSFSSCKKPIEPPNNLKSSQYILHKPPILHQNHLINSTATSTASSLSRNSRTRSLRQLSSPPYSASLAYNNLKSTNPDPNGSNDYNPLYAAIEQKISKSNEIS
ncbi:hypothetical protein NC653_032335 [Populus alba x Populus x berolinensis]|uniref:Uncharacterized protein n=1 Tax=Populus alba x Populus x berolinensis TaxID=444605 RepID=A0AAD6PYY7_9ROSI|nr:hypothetical protein NC653_032335 [Populus alba x Populus x berolinensis]